MRAHRTRLPRYDNRHRPRPGKLPEVPTVTTGADAWQQDHHGPGPLQAPADDGAIDDSIRRMIEAAYT